MALGGVPHALKEHVEKYNINIKKAPNYSTQLPFHAESFLETKVLGYLLEYMNVVRLEAGWTAHDSLTLVENQSPNLNIWKYWGNPFKTSMHVVKKDI